MVISKNVKKNVMIVSIVLLSITLAVVIFLGERNFNKKEKKIYEGYKNVMVVPQNSGAVCKNY